MDIRQSNFACGMYLIEQRVFIAMRSMYCGIYDAESRKEYSTRTLPCERNMYSIIPSIWHPSSLTGVRLLSTPDYLTVPILT